MKIYKAHKLYINLLLATVLLFTTFMQAQDRTETYKDGEWLKFRVHYGIITGGYATINVEDKILDGKKVHHIQGFGETTGIIGFTFGVEDYYESWVDVDTDLPYKFLRKIDEGGHTKNKIITFDQDLQKAHVQDLKHDKEKTVTTEPNIQDLVSAMYYLRNNLDTSSLKNGDETKLTMFFDGENYPFKMRFVGRETIDTKFGKIKAMVFKPLVQSGRVFKEKESLTIWISDDANKIPLRIKASLAIGSLKADLDAFKGLSNPFKVIVD